MTRNSRADKGGTLPSASRTQSPPRTTRKPFALRVTRDCVVCGLMFSVLPGSTETLCLHCEPPSVTTDRDAGEPIPF
jgi:hypothetical protein